MRVININTGRKQSFKRKVTIAPNVFEPQWLGKKTITAIKKAAKQIEKSSEGYYTRIERLTEQGKPQNKLFIIARKRETSFWKRAEMFLRHGLYPSVGFRTEKFEREEVVKTAKEAQRQAEDMANYLKQFPQTII